MAAEATVDQLIADQNARATELNNQLIRYASDAQTAALAITSITGPGTIVAPSINFAAWNPFAVNETGEFKVEFNAAKPTFAADLAAAFQAFVNMYFPDIAGCIRDNSDNWICDMIVNGGNGIPAAVEQQIWDRARSREVELARAATDNATNEWAARGFSLPPGALANAVAKAKSDATDKAATISRDQAIKNIEIQIENIRFAVEQAVKLRLGALAAAVDYIKAYMTPTALAIDYAKGLTDAHYRYYNGMQDYYGAKVAAARLTLDASIANAANTINNNKAFVDLVVGGTNARANAAVGAARALGEAAAGALGALNSVANIGYNTNA